VTQVEINRTAEGPPRRPSGPTYWLITTSQNEHREVLTLDHDGEEMLPVFSHEEEAETFLRLGGMGYGWRVGKSSAHELVSVLYGPCAGVREVALDPLPEMVAEGSLELGLASPGALHTAHSAARRRPLKLRVPDRG
jgi:hypothetical protein